MKERLPATAACGMRAHDRWAARNRIVVRGEGEHSANNHADVHIISEPGWILTRDLRVLASCRTSLTDLTTTTARASTAEASRFENRGGVWFPRHPLPANDADWHQPRADRAASPHESDVQLELDDMEESTRPGWFRHAFEFWPQHELFFG